MKVDGKYELPTYEIIGTIRYFDYDKELFLVYEDSDEIKWCYINPFKNNLMYFGDVERYVGRTFKFINCINSEATIYSPKNIEEINII